MSSEQVKEMEAAAKAYGHRIATPMLRSMWPSMSRGAFADFLACAFSEGWKAASERKDAKDFPENWTPARELFPQIDDEVKDLESKLATALEALERIQEADDSCDSKTWYIADEAIAKIKGEK